MSPLLRAGIYHEFPRIDNQVNQSKGTDYQRLADLVRSQLTPSRAFWGLALLSLCFYSDFPVGLIAPGVERAHRDDVAALRDLAQSHLETLVPAVEQ